LKASEYFRVQFAENFMLLTASRPVSFATQLGVAKLFAIVAPA